MPRKPKQRLAHPYGKEAELCTAFIEVARGYGFQAFPETGGADILLVATAECPLQHIAAGDQIAIQAKLRCNIEVLNQALPPKRRSRGAHYYGVLVPIVMMGFQEVAARCGLVVFGSIEREARKHQRFGYAAVTETFGFLQHEKSWIRHDYKEKLWVPPVEVSGAVAGTAGPKQLTPWKFGAVNLCLRAVQRGYITTKDFAEFKVSISTWFQKNWIIEKGKDGRRKRYALNPDAVTPDKLYPELVEALQEKVDE